VAERQEAETLMQVIDYVIYSRPGGKIDGTFGMTFQFGFGTLRMRPAGFRAGAMFRVRWCWNLRSDADFGTMPTGSEPYLPNGARLG
jgi:hypothetical protein